MLRAYDNIWDWYDLGHWIVIPTNIGWTATGANVMGRGLAFDANKKFPGLAATYGEFCQDNRDSACVLILIDLKLILFPTKPLNKSQPHLSWQHGSTIETIKNSLDDLLFGLSEKTHSDESLFEWMQDDRKCIVFPLVGCGNGGLSPQVVVPILEEALPGNLFVLCTQQ